MISSLVRVANMISCCLKARYESAELESGTGWLDGLPEL